MHQQLGLQSEGKRMQRPKPSQENVWPKGELNIQALSHWDAGVVWFPDILTNSFQFFFFFFVKVRQVLFWRGNKKKENPHYTREEYIYGPQTCLTCDFYDEQWYENSTHLLETLLQILNFYLFLASAMRYNVQWAKYVKCIFDLWYFHITMGAWHVGGKRPGFHLQHKIKKKRKEKHTPQNYNGSGRM